VAFSGFAGAIAVGADANIVFQPERTAPVPLTLVAPWTQGLKR
jgi:hypothetical protein